MTDCFLDSIVYEYNNRLSCKKEKGSRIGSVDPQNNSVAWQ